MESYSDRQNLNRIHHNKSSLTRNVNVSFKQKRPQLEVRKYMKGKNLTGKSKHIVKAVDQPLKKKVKVRENS